MVSAFIKPMSPQPSEVAIVAFSPRVRDLGMAEARALIVEGRITGNEWRAYAHAWQTGAPRFELRICHCAECVAAFPDGDRYRGGDEGYQGKHRYEWSMP